MGGSSLGVLRRCPEEKMHAHSRSVAHAANGLPLFMLYLGSLDIFLWFALWC